MNFFYTIFFFLTSILFSSTPENFSHEFTSIEQDEVNFLESLYKDKKENTITMQVKTPIETVEKRVINQVMKKEILLESKRLLAKKETLRQEEKYLALKKELATLKKERQERKAFLKEWTEDTSKEFKVVNSKYKEEQKQRKKELDSIEFEAKKKRRLAYIHKQEALTKLKKQMQKRKKARLKKEKAKKAKAKKALENKKLAEKKRKEQSRKGKIKVRVTLSKQRMKVYKDKELLYTWKVSTARRGHNTPTGNFKAQLVKKMHYSSLYNNSPMPYTIFYDGNYAIHGTGQTRKLGRPASHGCVRLHTKNAKKLYKLARKYGRDNMFVKIVR